MDFLLDRRGSLIAASSIDRIGPLIANPAGNYFDIDYHVGSEPRATTASEEDVQALLEAQS
jgi:hypothetical protein